MRGARRGKDASDHLPPLPAWVSDGVRESGKDGTHSLPLCGCAVCGVLRLRGDQPVVPTPVHHREGDTAPRQGGVGREGGAGGGEATMSGGVRGRWVKE